jgi:hypothetical protein
MIVILCFALSLSYMLKYGDAMRYQNEGMTTKLEEGNLKDNDSINIDKKTDSVKIKDDIGKISDISTTKKKDSVIPELSENKPIEKKEDNDNTKKLKKTMNNMTPGMDKETQAEYKNLLELQLKLIDGISNMQPVLSEVAQKIDNMKKTMKSPGF